MIGGPSFDAARMDDLSELLAYVDAECARAGVVGADAFAVRLSAEEAFTNIIRHGYAADQPGPVSCTLSIDSDVATLTFRDRAPPFDPRNEPPPDLTVELEERADGGLGLHLIRQLMDEVRHSRDDGEAGNVLTLVKHLGEAE